jgi:hypothetical protein
LSPAKREEFDQILSQTPDPKAAAKDIFIDELLRHDSGVQPNAFDGSRERAMQDFAERKLGAKGPVDRDQFFDLAKQRFVERGAHKEDMGAKLDDWNARRDAHRKEMETIYAPAKQVAGVWL